MDFDELEEVEEVATAKKTEAEEKAAADRAAAAEKLSAERRAMVKGTAEKTPEAPKLETNGTNGTNGAHGTNGTNGHSEPSLLIWEVVGGADKGGILVRDGESTSSTQLPARLSTGATVEQLELKGQRLHYRLKTGTGPEEGWISIALSGKDLAVLLTHIPVAKRDTEPRCLAELAKAPVAWTPVSMPQLQEKHMQMAPGIIYKIDFPFNAELLQKMGPAWLTKAFHTAGSIPKDNKVKTLKNVKEYIGGGNCSKLVFDVEYEKPAADLHTELFAKIPFPLGGNTLSDRMASSVMQTGSELGELNAQRLLESRLPFSIPRYYFGDVSNDTSNWILITERIPFGKQDGDRAMDPAYDKMKDWELKGSQDEYYFLLTTYGARMAGMDKAEALASRAVMDSFFPSAAQRPKEHWGMRAESSGIGEKEFNAKIKMGVDFVGTTGKALFPAECATPAFLQKYKRILAVSNAYTAEMQWWCNRNPDYIAWSHGNLNVDNVFFWRDADNKLDLGVLDWGGARTDSVGWKLWWWLYCCEYDFLNKNLDDLLDCFIKEYEASGGPKLDRAELRWQFTLSALQQGVGLLGAVPQIYKMCKKAEFATIKDRLDPRISQNIDGKNTLRIYIGTFINICNMIKDWDIESQLDKWVKEVCSAIGIPEKKVVVE